LNEDFSNLEVLNFYQSPQQLAPILEYFGSNVYKSKKWADYIKDYSINKSKTKK
jgi:hypothetical protein